MTMKHTVQVGDVFVESWGYDQTNIDYYEVIRVMPQSVEIVHIPAKTVGEGHRTRLTPDVGARHDPDDWRTGKRWGTPFIKRVKEGRDKPYLNMTSFSNAYLWNRESTHFDTIAAGYPGH